MDWFIRNGCFIVCYFRQLLHRLQTKSLAIHWWLSKCSQQWNNFVEAQKMRCYFDFNKTIAEEIFSICCALFFFIHFCSRQQCSLSWGRVWYFVVNHQVESIIKLNQSFTVWLRLNVRLKVIIIIQIKWSILCDSFSVLPKSLPEKFSHFFYVTNNRIGMV